MPRTRNTNQRQLILDTVGAMYHPSAEEVYVKIRQIDSKLGRATVFRNLNSLTLAGKLMRIVMPAGADRFETTTKSHSHMVCERCGRIFDVEYVPKIDLPKSNDYVAKSYALVFTGTCKECLKKESEEKENGIERIKN